MHVGSGERDHESSLRGALATKQSIAPQVEAWIASRSLSSGAHSRDPLARNDEQPQFSTVWRRYFSGGAGGVGGALSASDLSSARAPISQIICETTSPFSANPFARYSNWVWASRSDSTGTT